MHPSNRPGCWTHVDASWNTRSIYSPTHISDPILSVQLWLSSERGVVLLLKHLCPGLLSRSLSSICMWGCFVWDSLLLLWGMMCTCCYCAALCWLLLDRGAQGKWENRKHPSELCPIYCSPPICHRVGEGSEKEQPVYFAYTSTQNKIFSRGKCYPIVSQNSYFEM